MKTNLWRLLLLILQQDWWRSTSYPNVLVCPICWPIRFWRSSRGIHWTGTLGGGWRRQVGDKLLPTVPSASCLISSGIPGEMMVTWRSCDCHDMALYSIYTCSLGVMNYPRKAKKKPLDCKHVCASYLDSGFQVTTSSSLWNPTCFYSVCSCCRWKHEGGRSCVLD